MPSAWLTRSRCDRADEVVRLGNSLENTAAHLDARSRALDEREFEIRKREKALAQREQQQHQVADPQPEPAPRRIEQEPQQSVVPIQRSDAQRRELAARIVRCAAVARGEIAPTPRFTNDATGRMAASIVLAGMKRRAEVSAELPDNMNPPPARCS